MNKTILGVLGLTLALLSTPTFAAHPTQQQWQDAQQWIHDTSCSVHNFSVSCTTSTDGSRVEVQTVTNTTTTQLPDTVSYELVTPETPAHSGYSGDGKCPPFQENVNGMKNADGSLFCVAVDGIRITGQSGSPASYRKVVTPGGTETNTTSTDVNVDVATCTVDNRSLSYTGGNPFNKNNYDYNHTSSTSDGACN